MINLFRSQDLRRTRERFARTHVLPIARATVWLRVQLLRFNGSSRAVRQGASFSCTTCSDSIDILASF